MLVPESQQCWRPTYLSMPDIPFPSATGANRLLWKARRGSHYKVLYRGSAEVLHKVLQVAVWCSAPFEGLRDQKGFAGMGARWLLATGADRRRGAAPDASFTHVAGDVQSTQTHQLTTFDLVYPDYLI